MARFLLVCLGGALGTGARYLLTGWIPKALGPSFPYGTLTVNVVGSFLMALVMTVALSTSAIPPSVRLFLTIGFMGGFTTYSSFSYETLTLIQQRAWLSVILDVGLTVGIGLLASVLGLIVAKALLGR
jgi:CrcB protein